MVYYVSRLFCQNTNNGTKQFIIFLSSKQIQIFCWCLFLNQLRHFRKPQTVQMKLTYDSDLISNSPCLTFSNAGCWCTYLGKSIDISESKICDWTSGPLSGTQQINLQYRQSTGGFVLSSSLCCLVNTDKQIHWHPPANSLFIPGCHYDLLICRWLKDPDMFLPLFWSPSNTNMQWISNLLGVPVL